jgi:hypothetical protein
MRPADRTETGWNTWKASKKIGETPIGERLGGLILEPFLTEESVKFQIPFEMVH